MGVGYSSFQAPPQGAAIFEIETRECCSACQNRHWDEGVRQPPQTGAWSSGKWSDFSREMGNHVRRFRKDGRSLFALLLIPVGFIVGLIVIPGDPMKRSIIHLAFLFGSIFVCFVCNGMLRSANQAVDRDIEDLCRRYSDGAVHLQYATQFTGQCKPKGARTYRALYVVPAGGMQPQTQMTQPQMQPLTGVAVVAATPAQQHMQVTCPATCKPGDAIMITTPSGMQSQVVVPDGVYPGGIFMVQVPAQGPVPVVSAVPVLGREVLA